MPTIEIDALSLDECMSRKDRLEAIAMRGAANDATEAAVAWHLLMQRMIEMSLPDAPATPKFNDLILSIWRAHIRAKLNLSQAPASIAAEANKTILPRPTLEPQ